MDRGEDVRKYLSQRWSIRFQEIEEDRGLRLAFETSPEEPTGAHTYPLTLSDGTRVGFLSANGETAQADEVETNRTLVDVGAAIELDISLYEKTMEAQEKENILEVNRALSEAYFTHSPAPMLILDFSFLTRMGKAYKTSDPLELKAQLENNREELFAAIRRGVLIEANEASLRLFAASSKEELEDQLPTIIGEKGFPSLLRGTVDLILGKRVFETETVHRRLDGKELLIILKLAVVPGYEETLERVLVSVSDITKSKELQRQIDVLSLLPEINPDMVLVMECPNTISYVNPAARIWLREEGYDSVEELHRVLPAHYRENVCEYCDKSSTYTERLTYGERVYRFKKKPLSGAQKCMITISDVTEFERISKERELYYQAFRSSIHAMVITDAEGKIEYVNPKFEELYGVSAIEARGRNPRILNPGRETYRDLGYSDGQYEELFSGMWKSISNPEIGFWDGEVVNRKPDGQLVWINLLISAVFDNEGEISHYIGIPLDVSERRRREMHIRMEIIHTITELAEMRDNETGAHIQRVGMYSGLIAERLGTPKKFREDIETFAPHHDIGKVGISDTLLLAERRLTDEEFEIMKTHTSHGYQLLTDKPALEMAASIAYTHHEKYDGRGYPRGLAGEQIPLEGRITALVDVYDALRSRRPYKEPWSHHDAREEIRRSSGSHFDPRLVETFLALEKDFEEIAQTYADE